MPSILKRQSAKGVRWRAEAIVEHTRGGRREYKTFSTKAEALQWAIEREREGISGIVSGRTLADLFDRYKREVSSRKAGRRWEEIRLTRMAEALGSHSVGSVESSVITAWREHRLDEVAPASVRREMNLLGHVFSIAVKEWGWLKESPMKDVKRPASSPPREKVYSADEVERILHVAGTDAGTVTGRVGLAFRFALETGMRAGEIVGLTWDRVFPAHVRVEKGKTDAARRDVPLSKAARAVLDELRGLGGELVFDLTSAQLDALWRKIARKAVVDGHWHDTRHTAATKLAQKLSVMELAKSLGIRDLKTLQAVYFNPSAAELAAKLD